MCLYLCLSLFLSLSHSPRTLAGPKYSVAAVASRIYVSVFTTADENDTFPLLYCVSDFVCTGGSFGGAVEVRPSSRGGSCVCARVTLDNTPPQYPSFRRPWLVCAMARPQITSVNFRKTNYKVSFASENPKAFLKTIPDPATYRNHAYRC